MTFGATENTIEYAVRYMNIYAIGTLFVELTLGMNAFITAEGFTRTSMLSVLIGAIINIVLDPIFIFALNMGVEGAALATVISQLCSTIWVLCFLAFSKKTILRLRAKNFFVSPKIMLPCVALGLSTFVMQSSESIIIVCFNSSLKAYGGDLAVGAMTIISSLTQFALLPLQGICQGAQPISSYNYGAHNPDRVKKCFKLLLVTCVAYSTLLWLTVMVFPNMYAHMFTTSEELIGYSIKPLRVYFAVMLIFGTQTACQMTFVSIGETVSSIIVAVVRKFVLLLPFIYLLPMIFSKDKAMAVFMAEPIADVIAVTFTVMLFSIQFKRALKRIEPDSLEIN